MTAACRDAGFAAPVLEEIATRFRATLPAERAGPTVPDEADQAISAALVGSEDRHTSEVGKAMGRAPHASHYVLGRRTRQKPDKGDTK